MYYEKILIKDSDDNKVRPILNIIQNGIKKLDSLNGEEKKYNYFKEFIKMITSSSDKLSSDNPIKEEINKIYKKNNIPKQELEKIKKDSLISFSLDLFSLEDRNQIEKYLNYNKLFYLEGNNDVYFIEKKNR